MTQTNIGINFLRFVSKNFKFNYIADNRSINYICLVLIIVIIFSLFIGIIWIYFSFIRSSFYLFYFYEILDDVLYYRLLVDFFLNEKCKYYVKWWYGCGNTIVDEYFLYYWKCSSKISLSDSFIENSNSTSKFFWSKTFISLFKMNFILWKWIINS